MIALLVQAAVAAAEEEPSSALFPKTQELIWGALAFGVLFFFMAKWAFPRVNQALEARREKIQGDLEKAEQARREAEALRAQYQEQLAGAREEANRIIEEARKTAEQLRRDLQARAEQEAQAMVARAQEEIRAERDRVVQELKPLIGQWSLELATKVVGESLDGDRHRRLIERYIEQVTASGNGSGS